MYTKYTNQGRERLRQRVGVPRPGSTPRGSVTSRYCGHQVELGKRDWQWAAYCPHRVAATTLTRWPLSICVSVARWPLTTGQCAVGNANSVLNSHWRSHLTQFSQFQTITWWAVGSKGFSTKATKLNSDASNSTTELKEKQWEKKFTVTIIQNKKRDTTGNSKVNFCIMHGMWSSWKGAALAGLTSRET